MPNYTSSHTGSQLDTAINRSLGLGYAICNTAVGTTTKTVSISPYNLLQGATITIKFTYAVDANSTLNVENTGAKPIYYKGKAVESDIVKAGDIITFVYDGTNYNILSAGASIYYEGNTCALVIK